MQLHVMLQTSCTPTSVSLISTMMLVWNGCSESEGMHCGRFYGVMAVYATPDLAFGSVISGFFYSFWNLFAGFLIGVNVSSCLARLMSCAQCHLQMPFFLSLTGWNCATCWRRHHYELHIQNWGAYHTMMTTLVQSVRRQWFHGGGGTTM